MNLREKLVSSAGGLVCRDFSERASGFGAGGRGKAERLGSLVNRARSLLPGYDAACAAALGGRPEKIPPADFCKLPVMRRADLAGYAGGAALARLESGGTGSSGRVETRLDLEAVVSRYAALLSVLKETGWRMGEKTAALHPVEYGYFNNLPAMLSGGQFGRIFFEFFQQYVLYGLVHNRKNVYYDRGIFSDSGAARALALKAASQEPALLISRPDALMAVLKSLRGGGPVFKNLKAVLTVGTALVETVRLEAERVLGAPVYNMYASTELGYAALSCRHSEGWLHADRAGHILEAGPDGGLLCTDLDNALTPLLRYDTGDAGELAERGCLCGRAGQMLKFRGRQGKFLETSAGRLFETEVIAKTFPGDLPFFQLDAAAGLILLPPGCGEREAAAVRAALGLPPGRYGAFSAENFRISSSGKFCHLL